MTRGGGDVDARQQAWRRWWVTVVCGMCFAACTPEPTPDVTQTATVAPAATVAISIATATDSGTDSLTETPTNTLTPRSSQTPVVTTTPFAFATGTSSSLRQPCSDAPPSRLILFERGRVSDDDDRVLNVRETPTTESDIVTVLEVGQVFLVVDGPICADGYVWYEVEFAESEGWVAEGEPDLYYVEPYLPG